MDLTKIGRYIADKRKKLGLTQRQLAEQLGMSDKSVSKWERGICLPDVSVYLSLCGILGISINEFLAGEDIPRESMVQKSEENLLGVTADSKKKQNRLKLVIWILTAVTVIVLSLIAVAAYLEAAPKNFLAPLDPDSIEMQTAELLAGPDGVFLYQFTTTEEYRTLRLYRTEYHAGEMVDRGQMELGFESIGSPEGGAILILPDFKNFVVKLVISAGGAKYATELPILENVPGREHYARSATGITEQTDIAFDREQHLLALIYDNGEMWVQDIHDLMDGETDALAKNDYVYYFSFSFCRE